MNNKNIKRHLRDKITNWTSTIEDENIKNIIKANTIVSGGAIVSLLNGEEPHDYDIYFKTKESIVTVAKYYANLFNLSQAYSTVEIRYEKPDRVECFIKSEGIVGTKEELTEEEVEDIENTVPTKKAKKPSYSPMFFSTNAISLSDKIQLVIRFFGSVEDIHLNFDYVHCTCSYDYDTDKLILPSKALEAIINKELIYTGSKYPLCSIIRTRKFIKRGWHINAGQYVKMALQLNDMDLKNVDVLREQLVGMDSAYFEALIAYVNDGLENDPNLIVDSNYLMNAIDIVFGEE